MRRLGAACGDVFPAFAAPLVVAIEANRDEGLTEVKRAWKADRWRAQPDLVAMPIDEINISPVCGQVDDNPGQHLAFRNVLDSAVSRFFE